MANPNSPYGLKPVRERDGSPYSGAANTYYVPSSDATALFIGDPVILAGSGDTSGNAPTVTRATAGATNRITGVVVGFQPSPEFVPYGYRPASTAMYVLVADDPFIEYSIQCDSTGLAVTQIGENANLTAGSGSTATKRSGFILDGTTPDVDATYQLRILGFEPQINNEVGAYVRTLVRINLPTEAGIASGLGI